MVILFLTGGLEPGQDGVGDYTRRLACECIRQGHEARIIALSDSRVNEPYEATEETEGGLLPVLRLPGNLTWTQRSELARTFRAHHGCDWISLQFVGYAYHAHGIAGPLTKALRPVVAGCPFHIMFHELWIGGDSLSSFRHRVLAYLQRYQVKQMIRFLSPRAIATTNPFYRDLLQVLNRKVIELPLFGNIPIGPVLEPLVPSFSQGLFFGSLHREWKAEPFMSIWIAASTRADRQPCLISVGRLGAVGEQVWQKLQTDYAGKVDFLTLGEQPAPVISSWLQLADFGLAASPWFLMGKSGSVAAMLDHGLPVIVTREDGPRNWVPPPSPDSLLHRCDGELGGKLVVGLPKRKPRNRCRDVASDFIRILAAG